MSPGWIPDRYQRLRALLGRSADDVDEELRAHLERLTERYRAEGHSPAEARARAEARFGDLRTWEGRTRVEERRSRRATRRRERVQRLGRELGRATRALVRSPTYSLASLVTLGLALAGTAAAFTLVHSVVLRPLPYPEPDRLVMLDHPVPGLDAGARWGLSSAGFHYFRDSLRSLSDLGVWTWSTRSIGGDGGAERVRGAMVSASLLPILGASPLLGRLLTESDNLQDAALVVVLSHGLWTRSFGADPEIVGRTITVDAAPWTVVGVLAEDVDPPFGTVDLWIPLTIDPSARAINQHWLNAIGRLAPGATPESNAVEMAVLTERLPEVFPEAYDPAFMTDFRFSAGVRPLTEAVVGGAARSLWLLLVAAGAVLIVATANVAALGLVRAEERAGDVAVRRALGASRSDLALFALSEGWLLAGSAALLALPLAGGVVAAVRAARPPGIPRLAQAGLSPVTMAMVVAGALVVGVMIAALPLVRRTPAVGLRGGRGRGAPSQRLRGALVVAQVALALALVSGAGVLMRSVRNLAAVDPGMRTGGVVVFDVALPLVRYRSYDDVAAFLEGLSLRLEALPGVLRAAATNQLPLGGGRGCSSVYIEDRPVPEDRSPPCVPTPSVAPGFFEALGIPLEGRAPTWGEVRSHRGEAVVSRAFAERFWPGENPIGKGVRGGRGEVFFTVVGVAGDVRNDDLRSPPWEAVYFPLVPKEGASLWSPPRLPTIVVRTASGGPEALFPAARSILRDLDPEVPLVNPSTLDAVVTRSMGSIRFVLGLVAAGAMLALLLSAIGLYGVVAYMVRRRRPEIGVRMAIGAGRSDVVAHVVRSALGLTGLGIVVGVGVAWVGTRALDAFVFGVEPRDPATLAGTVGILIAIGFLSSFGPARRAAAIDPAEVLRAE